MNNISRRKFLNATPGMIVASVIATEAGCRANTAFAEPGPTFCDLVAEYRRLEDEYNALPDNGRLEVEMRWLERNDDLEDEIAETPVTSTKAALEAIRLVNHRMDGSEATYVDRAILRSVQLFMEG